MKTGPTALAVLIAAIYAPAMAPAQTATPPVPAASGATAQAAPAEATRSELEAVVVTGQKRKESAQKAALSITAVDGASINEQGQNGLQDALKSVPGVVMQEQSRGSTPTIRGLGADLPPGVGDGAVATNYDGVYNVRPEGSQSMFDVSRIEVLRGPQSTLYGRSGPAGVVNVITNDPTFKREGHATFEVGSYGLLRSELVLNQPLSETLSIRGALTSQNRDGYMSNGTTDAKTFAGRLKVLYKPKEDFSVLLGTEAIRLNGRGVGTVPAYATEPADPYEAPPAPGQRDKYQGQKYWAQVDTNVGIGRLTALASTASAKNEELFPTGPNVVEGQDPKSLRQNSFELRLASQPESALKWLVGYYNYSNHLVVSTVPTGSPAGTTLTVQDTTADSNALFGNVSVPLAAGMRAIGGLRYSSDKKSVKHNMFFPVQDSAGSFSRTDGKIGLEVDTGPQSLMYATVSTGYRPGGWSLAPPYDPIKPETLTSLEVGSKNQFFDNRLRLNASLYYYKYKNYQISDLFFPPGSPFPVLAFYNVEKATNYGGEMEATWRASDVDTLGLSMSYVHATFDSSLVLHPDPIGSPAVDIQGRTLPHSPKLTVAARYARQFYFESGASVSARFDVRHVGSQYVAPNQQPLSFQKAYWTGDVSVSYRPADANWSLTGYVKNVNDVAVKTGYFLGYNTLAAPRTFGLVANIEF
ncbi:MAG TPA: TonB-dependent receptor [Burkholderiaceae bacterium]|nr:TonB-dependent receptor [Burkholderiaceae bacterium]